VADLRWLCTLAKRWQGSDGSHRKVFVTDFEFTAPFAAAHKLHFWNKRRRGESTSVGYFATLQPMVKKQKATHLEIATCSLDGQRKLHRHFLRLADGSIIELFGEVSAITGGE
jgi:hypothetical protein